MTDIVYTLRNGEIKPIVHLRGQLYTPASELDAIVIRDGVKYAPTEWVVGKKNVFATMDEAKAVKERKEKTKSQKQKREETWLRKMMEKCDAIISEIMIECDKQDIDYPMGLSMMIPEELEDLLRRIKRRGYEQRR